jgi:hypothetical protein
MTTSFIDSKNKLYGGVSKASVAQKMWKTTVNVGEAVVNVLGAFGIAGFKFHVPQTEQVRLENEITDHYVESNYAIQDHIARKPVTITLTGLVGDYFYSIHEIEDKLALITPTLTLVKTFLPEITSVVQRKKIAFNKERQQHIEKQNDGSYKVSVNGKQYEYEFNAMDLFTLFQNLYKLKSAQARAFIFFEAMWKSGARFSVETTWKKYNNMVVLSVTPKRDNNADITEFTVVCKQIDFAQTQVETIEEYKNRMQQQKSEIVNKGVEKGEELPPIPDVNPFDPER